MKKLKIFGIVGSLVFLASCETTNRQIASNSPPAFTYESSHNCTNFDDPSESRQKRSEQDRVWSPLSGMMVGPTQFERFKNPGDKMLRPFVSDGCSLSLDGVPATKNSEAWAACCVAHDISYWIGGTEKERNEADQNFGRCVAGKGYAKIGNIYRAFVQKFGGPNSNMTFRWGYGWNYRRPYSSLTVEELAQTQPRAELEAKTRRLVMSCDTYDHAVDGFKDVDRQIYQLLGLKLKKDSRAQWVKLNYYNRSKQVFLVKLDDCEAPLEIAIPRSAPQKAQLRGKCPGYLG